MMRQMRFMVIVVLVVCGLARLAHAAPEEMAFQIKLRGITAGTLVLTGAVEGGRYQVSGQIESTGLVRILRAFGYSGMAQGQVRTGRLVPERYEGRGYVGQRKGEVLIDYPGGVPRVLRYVSSRLAGPDSPDPASQTDAMDQLSAGFALLRDVSAEEACRFDAAVFDGRRRSSLRLAKRADTEGGVICRGEYQRQLGYTEEELAQKARFPLEVVYAPTEAGTLRVAEVRFSSLYGPLVLDRR